ncbi:MAG: methyltransferase domain-containing protein [Sphingobacteriales bacterium]|nr:MAG: methyltransferase domain-containing protein [Sphingobacteriales bacterium]
MYQPGKIRLLFNTMSRTYERVNYITSFGFSSRWRRQFIRRVNPSAGKVKIIDLMTGMGETWPVILKHFPAAELTALDFSPGMLRFARQKNHKKYNDAVQITEQDMLHNELPSAHFDYVFCAFGLKTFSKAQLQQLAAEVKRILKVNGQFSFIEVSVPRGGFLKLLYTWYLKRLIPVLGRMLLGNPAEYKMLAVYTSKFKDARHVCKIFADAGLTVKYDSYFNGCASGIHGIKQ